MKCLTEMGKLLKRKIVIIALYDEVVFALEIRYIYDATNSALKFAVALITAL